MKPWKPLSGGSIDFFSTPISVCMEIDKEIQAYYNTGIEKDRLNTDVFQLERERTEEILLRFIPKNRSKILDVGGGTGHYAFWLKEKGHEVHLVDPVRFNIDAAKAEAKKRKLVPDSIQLAEARDLPWEDNRFDVVLLMGPLYHLTKKKDREEALKEASRVTKNGGLVMAVGISRYASLMDGFFRNMIKDPDFFQIVDQDIATGQHRNFTDKLAYFTTAYFHHPEALQKEIREAGLHIESTIAIESFGWLIPDFIKKWAEKDYKPLLLESIRRVETQDDLLSISAHFMVVARKAKE
jgi:ubiquinone/menaquinone biosynthesis C-methylase UbiE